jgi:hypothetical protein
MACIASGKSPASSKRPRRESVDFDGHDSRDSPIVDTYDAYTAPVEALAARGAGHTHDVYIV